MAPGHPGHEVLADLVADVLPVEQARDVEAHVMGCATCSALLTEADRVSELLRQDVPGTVPPDVAARVDAAIRQEVAARSAGSDADSATPQRAEFHDLGPRTAPRGIPLVMDPGAGQDGTPDQDPDFDRIPGLPPGTGSLRLDDVAAAVADPSIPIGGTRSGNGRDTRSGARPASGPAAPSGGPAGRTGRGGSRSGPATGRILRPTIATGSMPQVGKERTGPPTTSLATVRGHQRTRRQARDEDRGPLPPWMTNRLVLAAAAVVLVAGVGGVGVKLVTGALGDSSGGSAATAASIERAAGASGGVEAQADLAASRVTATGTKYTEKGLADQVRTLVAVAAKAGSSAPVASGNAAVPSPKSSANDSAAVPDAAAARRLAEIRTTQGGQLLEPRALAECLNALEAGDEEPLAVDLATFEGQEAAVIVLPGRNGGYEVWAVTRDCQPGDGGILEFTSVPS